VPIPSSPFCLPSSHVRWVRAAAEWLPAPTLTTTGRKIYTDGKNSHFRRLLSSLGRFDETADANSKRE
jgi:hypothetical protein